MCKLLFCILSQLWIDSAVVSTDTWINLRVDWICLVLYWICYAMLVWRLPHQAYCAIYFILYYFILFIYLFWIMKVNKGCLFPLILCAPGHGQMLSGPGMQLKAASFIYFHILYQLWFFGFCFPNSRNIKERQKNILLYSIVVSSFFWISIIFQSVNSI